MEGRLDRERRVDADRRDPREREAQTLVDPDLEVVPRRIELVEAAQELMALHGRTGLHRGMRWDSLTIATAGRQEASSEDPPPAAM